MTGPRVLQVARGYKQWITVLWDPRLDVERAPWASAQLPGAPSIGPADGVDDGIALSIRKRPCQRPRLIAYDRRQLSQVAWHAPTRVFHTARPLQDMSPEGVVWPPWAIREVGRCRRNHTAGSGIHLGYITGHAGTLAMVARPLPVRVVCLARPSEHLAGARRGRLSLTGKTSESSLETRHPPSTHLRQC